jgi:hypothetical protein
MRILNQIIPMFLLIQFLVVLVGLVAAMLSTDPQASLPGSRRARGAGFLASMLSEISRHFSR